MSESTSTIYARPKETADLQAACQRLQNALELFAASHNRVVLCRRCATDHAGATMKKGLTDYQRGFADGLEHAAWCGDLDVSTLSAPDLHEPMLIEALQKMPTASTCLSISIAHRRAIATLAACGVKP